MAYIDETGLAEVTTKLKTYADNTLNKPMEISTETAMNNLLVAGNVGKAYKYVGTTTSSYTNGNIYIVEENIIPVDLTGTTWLFNDTVDVSQDFNYSINYTQIGDLNLYTTLSCSSGELIVGDDGYDDNSGEYLWWAPSSRVISITGGVDVTNNNLYQYLTDNATQITDTWLSDLNGTTWVFNNVLVGGNTQTTASGAGLSAEFTSDSANYDTMWIYPEELAYVNNSEQPAPYVPAYTLANGWANNALKTVEFTNTIDDGDIITFMYLNATKQ